jgi:hypothetical protein
MSQEQQPEGEESKREHAEVFRAAAEFDGIPVQYVTAGCIKVPYPNMWLRAVELRNHNNPGTTPDTAVI